MGVAPDRPYPDSAYGKRGTMRGFQDIDEAEAKRRMRKPIDDANNTAHGKLFGGLLNGFPNLLAGITGTVNDNYVRDLPIITNHTAQLSEQAEAIAQMTARGRAVPFSQSGWYYPPKDLVTLRLIGIGAGAGGAAGKWNLGAGGRFGGGGGGGGGYSEIEITAAFLPKTGDTFDPIRVDIYLAGNGGSGSEAPGGGGGNIIFGANLAKPYAEFQGGLGGRTATNTDGGGGPGGFGMVPGGYGGGGARSNLDEYPGGPGGSSFASERYAGGGAGGGGGSGFIQPAGLGGNGVGNAGGLPNQPGESPHPAMAVGAGAGGGSNNQSNNGGAGGFPGGGGGGGHGGLTAASPGGPGGQAKLYCYEEMN